MIVFCAFEAFSLAVIAAATATAPVDLDNRLGDARCPTCGRSSGAQCDDVGHLRRTRGHHRHDRCRDRDTEPLVVNA